MDKISVRLTRDQIFPLLNMIDDSIKRLKNSRVEEDKENIFTYDINKYTNSLIDEEIKKTEDLEKIIRESLLNEPKLDELSSKEEFIVKIKKLEKKIKYHKDEIENLEEDLKEKEELIKYYEKKDYVKIYDFYIDYKNQQQRYDFNDVDYQMKNIDDITRIFGMTMNDIKGFSSLTKEDQAIFSEGILRFINGWGLGDRVRNLPVKVWKEKEEFRFNTLGRDDDIVNCMDSEGNVY